MVGSEAKDAGCEWGHSHWRGELGPVTDVWEDSRDKGLNFGLIYRGNLP